MICREMTGLGPVLRVDTHVVVGQVRGPDSLGMLPPVQLYTDTYVLPIHNSLTLLLSIGAGAPALLGNQDIIEIS